MNFGFQEPTFKVETGDGHNVIMVEDRTFVARDGSVYTIKKGAQSDGGSTPRPLWTLFPPFGAEWRAYVLHDFLYRCTLLPRLVCDSILYEALISLGVGHVRAWEIYAGVREGGADSFAADRAAQTPTHVAMLEHALAA